MARITRYKQNNLASSLVGTPGVDRSGNILAQSIGNSLDQMAGAQIQMERQAQLTTDRNDAYLQQQTRGAFDSVAFEARKARAAQKAVNDAHMKEVRAGIVSGTVARARADVQNMIGSIQEEHSADPMTGLKTFEKVYNDFVKSTADSISDPLIGEEVRTKLVGSYDDYYKTVDNWARGEAANISRDLVNAIPATYAKRVSALRGSIQDRLDAFDEIRNEYTDKVEADIILRNGTYRGSQKNDQAREDMQEQLFFNLLNYDVPQGRDALRHIEAVRELATRPGGMFKDVLVKKPDFLRNTLDQRMRNVEQQLVRDAQDDALIGRLDLGEIKNKALARPKDRSAWTSMLEELNGKQRSLDQEIEAAKKEPNQGVRHATLQGLTIRENAINNMANFANGKIDQIDKAAEAAVRRREADANRRIAQGIAAQNRQAAAQRSADAAMRKADREARTERNKLFSNAQREEFDSINQTYQDLIGMAHDDENFDKDEFNSTMHDFIDQVEKAHNTRNEDGKYLLPNDSYSRFLNKARGLAAGVGAKHAEAEKLLGVIPMGEPDKAAAKSKAIAELDKMRDQVRAEKKYATESKSFATPENAKQLNPLFAKELDTLMSAAKASGRPITPAKKAQIEALAAKRAQEKLSGK
jgi:hypothetical protein